jgi:hypothetical protein
MKTSVLLPLMIKDKFQLAMTEFAIHCLTMTDEEFELVIVETGSAHFSTMASTDAHPVKWLGPEEKTSYTRDANIGLLACEGEFVVHTGNDVFVQQGWLEALHKPFETISDCGVSCLASNDLPPPLNTKGDFIVEGVYGPLMMFQREWNPITENFDELNSSWNKETGECPKFFDMAFPDIFSDTDLVLAHYAAGLRSYRNHAVVIHHLNKVTYDQLHTPEEQKERHQKYGQQMAAKHSSSCSHLRMYHHLLEGHVV